MEKTFETKCNDFKSFLKDKKFRIDDDTVNVTMAVVEQGGSVLAVGPTGSGKTDYFCLLSEFLKGEYYYQSLNGSVHIHDLTQERILAKNGTFEERDMILAQWLRSAKKKVSVLQFDEVNAAKPETLLSLHPIMDIKGELFLPYTNERLKVNKNAICVMTCNEGDEYAGINAMNMAFLNRPWVTIHFKYLDNNEMTTMLNEKTGVALGICSAVVRTWSKYMGSKDPEQPIVSPRVLLRWLELSKTIGLKTAGKFTFAGLIVENYDELVKIVEGDFFVNLPNM